MLVLLLLVVSCSGNLLPGDPGGGHHHHHHPHAHHDEDAGHHHEHVHAAHAEEDRAGRAESGNPGSAAESRNNNLIDFTSAVDDPDTGLKCVYKEETLQTLEKERLLECTHSMINVCHYTYVTGFKPNPEKVCEDHYEKICNIVFLQQAVNETVEHCYKPMVKECNDIEDSGSDGRTICKEMYETQCTTRYKEKGESKFVADTECRKLPVELCGSPSCRFVEGTEECHNKTTASITSVPEESCDLVPQQTCHSVYKLVPYLKPTHQCKDVPREICTFGVLSTKLGEAPLPTKWCYDPAEDDLSTTDLQSEGAQSDFAFPKTSIPPLTAPRGPPATSARLTFRPPAEVPFQPPDLEPRLEEVFFQEVDESKSRKASRPKPTASNYYLPPAAEFAQALDDQDRQGRKIKDNQKQTEEDEDAPVEQEDSRKLLEDLLETALETVKQDPEGAVDFGQRIIVDEPERVDTNLEDIIPDIFRFPAESEKSGGGKSKWKLPDDGAKADKDIEFFNYEKFPQEFREIFGAIDPSAKSKVKLAKVKPTFDVEGHKPIAKVIKHKKAENGVTRTVVIQNVPEAHKAFGIRNVPKDFFKHMKKVLSSGARPLSANPVIQPAGGGDFKEGVEPVEDDRDVQGEINLGEDVSNVGEDAKNSRTVGQTVIIKNTAEDFAKFGVKNVPKEFLDHLRKQERESKAIHSQGIGGNTVQSQDSPADEAEKQVFFDPIISDDIDIDNGDFKGGAGKKIDSYFIQEGQVAASPWSAASGASFSEDSEENTIHFKDENNIAPPPGLSRFTQQPTGAPTGVFVQLDNQPQQEVSQTGPVIESTYDSQVLRENKELSSFGNLRLNQLSRDESFSLGSLPDSSVLNGGSSTFNQLPLDGSITPGSLPVPSDGASSVSSIGNSALNQVPADGSFSLGSLLTPPEFSSSVSSFPGRNVAEETRSAANPSFSGLAIQNTFNPPTNHHEEAINPTHTSSSGLSAAVQTTVSTAGGDPSYQPVNSPISGQGSFSFAGSDVSPPVRSSFNQNLAGKVSSQQFVSNAVPSFSSSQVTSLPVLSGSFVPVSQSNSLSSFSLGGKSSFSSSGSSGSSAISGISGSSVGLGSFYQEYSAGSSSSAQINLKPVEQIVKPTARTTRKPHKFIRDPAVTRAQEFARPGRPVSYPASSNLNTDTVVQSNQYILTNRPMTFQTASGQFDPPSTLLYGFKPMTSAPPAAAAVTSRPYQNNPRLKKKPGTRLKKFTKLQPKAFKNSQEPKTMIDQISEFLQPFTKPFKSLLQN